jgi:hypothetical protein
VNGTPEVEQVAAKTTLKEPPDDTAVELKLVYGTGKLLLVKPDGELKVILCRFAEVALSGNPPTVKDTTVSEELQIAALAANGLNPLLLAVTLALGLKIPIEYRITATMTMISIAQP